MKPTHAKPQSGRAIEPGLALYIVSKRGHPVRFGQTGLLFANRQWGTFSLGSAAAASETITLPISVSSFLTGWTSVVATEQIGVKLATSTTIIIMKGSGDHAPRTGTWGMIAI